MSSFSLETIIVQPKLPAKSSIIWLHGLGADANDFVDMVPQLSLAEDLAVRFIFPHAPVRPVSLNAGMRMRAWFDVYGLTEHFPQDEIGINETDRGIRQLIQQEIAQGIPSTQIILAGFSQGGAVALYSGIRCDYRLGGILGLSTFLPRNHDQEKNKLETNQGLPIFLAHGTLDPVLSLHIGQISKERLIELGYLVEWHTYLMGHSVCEREIQDLSHWVKQVLTHESKLIQ